MDIDDLIAALEQQIIDAGLWREVLIEDFQPLSPPDGLTPREYCKASGHTLQTLRIIADRYGNWKAYRKCQFCGLRGASSGSGLANPTPKSIEEVPIE
jgi:hypothetical protein